MRALLWRNWDPFGLYGHGAPEGEYDSHANMVAGKLKHGNGHADIAEYLTTALLEEDEVVTPAWVARCNQTAQDLLDWYAQSDAPR
jgi:hypothetical protein